MVRKGSWTRMGMLVVVVALLMSVTSINFAAAQEEPPEPPEMLHPDLDVRMVVDGLDSPTTMAFLGPDEFLVLEKNTGQVRHVMNGEVQATVLDLAVNVGSERGLLGIALHPRVPRNPGVYLFWSCRSSAPPATVFGTHIPKNPSRWSASTTGSASRPSLSPQSACASAIVASSFARATSSGPVTLVVTVMTPRY